MPGMIAIGDSLINGLTPPVAGIPGKSWARWVAEAAGIAYEQHAKGGLTSSQIVQRFLPKVNGNYEYGVFGMGTNDALTGFDADVFRSNVMATAARMAEASHRVVVLSVPFSTEADAIVREVAGKYNALVVDAQVSGPLLFRPDGIHPTSVGYLEIGDRAASALGLPKPSLTAPVPRSLSLGYKVGHTALRAYYRAKNSSRMLLRR
jgi:lysophospholipase L1-like esterase